MAMVDMKPLSFRVFALTDCAKTALLCEHARIVLGSDSESGFKPMSARNLMRHFRVLCSMLGACIVLAPLALRVQYTFLVMAIARVSIEIGLWF